MGKITANELRGIWDGMTMSWDEDYRFDEDTYARNIERSIATKVHGMYTTGSAGEFYVLEYEEFCRMVDIIAELCGQAEMPLQIGCSSDATRKTIKLLEYAAGKEEVGAVQVTLPYWMELDDREVVQFFKDVHTACPEMPLVHYNSPRSKRFLRGTDYLRILEVAPNLIGVKHVGPWTLPQLQEDIMVTPALSYFVSELVLVSAMQLGARGCYSWLAGVNPWFALDMYGKAEAGQWDEAIKMQKRVCQFAAGVRGFVIKRNEHMTSGVADKGKGVAAGGRLGHQRCRPPYIGWSDETITALRAWMKENHPELVYPE